MTSSLGLRRHLYEQAAAGGRRHRRALRKQISLLALQAAGPDGEGPSPVREPRRPRPSSGPTCTEATP